MGKKRGRVDDDEIVEVNDDGSAIDTKRSKTSHEDKLEEQAIANKAALRDRGLVVVPVPEDGNCQFHAFGESYYDATDRKYVSASASRAKAVRVMQDGTENTALFDKWKRYLKADVLGMTDVDVVKRVYDAYEEFKGSTPRRPVWGNEMSLVALAIGYECQIHVWNAPMMDPGMPAKYGDTGPVVNLWYTPHSHYDAVYHESTPL